MSTRICLVRHGETAWNAERRLQGHLDIPLNEHGLAQAAATARSLDGERFDAAYCSDLTRARQTADAIASHLGLSLCQNAQLRERHYGVFQGLTYDEAQNQHPEAYRHFEQRDPDFAFAEGGESLKGFAARIQAALNDIARRHPDSTVLVVTHGGVLDIAHRLAAGKPLHTPRDFGIPNAALNWIEYQDGNWTLQVWAEQRHLDSSLDELRHA